MEQETPVMEREEEPIVKAAAEARQGTDKPPMLFVLVVGMTLASMSFLFMFLVR